MIIQTYNAHELIQAKKHREEVVLKADHLAVVAEKDKLLKEMREMVAFLIGYVPGITEKREYLDWLAERKEGV